MNNRELNKFISTSEIYIDGIYDSKLKKEVRVSNVSYNNMVDFITHVNNILIGGGKDLIEPTIRYDKNLCVILNFKNKTKIISIIFDNDGTYAKVHGMPYISGTIHRKNDITFGKVIDWLSNNMTN